MPKEASNPSPARGEGIVPRCNALRLLHPAPHPVVGEVHSRCLVPIPLDARMPNRPLIQPLSVMANRLVYSKNRITRAGRWLATRGAALFAELSEFQQRIWVVSIVNDTYTDTFIVNEGSFEEPMQWMRRKQYDADMLQRVDAMQRSQVIQFELGDIRHRLMRVK